MPSTFHLAATTCLASSAVHRLQSPFLAAVIAVGAAWSAAAQAQTLDPGPAEVLFREAREAAARGDYATACRKMEESYELEPAVGTLLNLAACDEEKGLLASAWTRYRHVLERLPTTDDRRSEVAALVQALEPRLPRLTLRFPLGAPEEITVFRDGIPVGRLSDGVATPIDPGPHEVIVQAQGRVARRYQLDLLEGETEELVCEPGEPVETSAKVHTVTPREPASATRREPDLAMTRSAQDRGRTAALVVGGIGVLGLLGGGATRAIAWAQRPLIDDGCSEERLCSERGLAAVERARTLETVSTISLITGTAALGAGLYLGLARSDRAPRRHATPSPLITLSPLVTAERAGFSLTRSF